MKTIPTYKQWLKENKDLLIFLFTITDTDKKQNFNLEEELSKHYKLHYNIIK